MKRKRPGRGLVPGCPTFEPPTTGDAAVPTPFMNWPWLKAFEPFPRLRSGLDCLSLGLGYVPRDPLVGRSEGMLVAFSLELEIQMRHIVDRLADETKG